MLGFYKIIMIFNRWYGTVRSLGVKNLDLIKKTCSVLQRDGANFIYVLHEHEYHLNLIRMSLNKSKALVLLMNR